MKRNCAPVVFAFWLCTAMVVAFAQSPSASAPTKTKFDPASQIKFTGEVDEIEQRNAGGTCKAPSVFVTLKANGETYELRVGPKWFIDNLTWTFTKGDKLDVVGWRLDKDNSTVTPIVVRKISRGEWNLEPRDDSGAANWLWMTAPKDSGKCN